jgi:hypothetical protein
MVYRDLPLEEAEKQHAELTATVSAPPVVEKPKPKKKVVKVIVPKSK